MMIMLKHCVGRMTSGTYLRHDGTSVIAFDVTEGHLRALVLVDLQLRVVDEWDLIHGHYMSLVYVVVV